MTALQALAIAVLQGITELFPVSSLGHAVILPALLGWHIDQQAESFLPFLVVLHLGTATALFAYFWRDWLDLGLALFGIGAEDAVMEGRRLIWLIVVATLPAVVLGLALEKEFRHLFGAPQAAAALLMVNGGVLFAGERLRHQTSSGERNLIKHRSYLRSGHIQGASCTSETVRSAEFLSACRTMMPIAMDPAKSIATIARHVTTIWAGLIDGERLEFG